MRNLLCLAVVLGLGGVANAQSGWNVSVTGPSGVRNFFVPRQVQVVFGMPVPDPPQGSLVTAIDGTEYTIHVGIGVLVGLSPVSMLSVRAQSPPTTGNVFGGALYSAPSNSFAGPINLGGTACSASVSPVP